MYFVYGGAFYAKKRITTIISSVLIVITFLYTTCFNMITFAISEDMLRQSDNSINPPLNYNLQAEACTLNGCSVGTYGEGYEGGGYVEYINEIGDGIISNYTTTAGYHSFTIRYSQGTGVMQTLSLFVGGKFIKKINFEPTGEWDTTWSTVQEIIYLPSGTTSIEFRYTAGDSDVDLDYINCSKTSSTEIKMVIVPHEDDEIFAFCGSIQSMIEAGDEVRVVLITNGDYYSTTTGVRRISESIAALEHIGVEKNDRTHRIYADRPKCY